MSPPIFYGGTYRRKSFGAQKGRSMKTINDKHSFSFRGIAYMIALCGIFAACKGHPLDDENSSSVLAESSISVSSSASSSNITSSSISSASSANSGIGIASHIMVSIESGSFQMGSPATEGFDPDETQHSVTLTKCFYMGKYQVTQELYQRVMGSNPSSFKTSAANGEEQARRPVEQVSWYDALVFCNKLSVLEGLAPVYSISGSTDPAAWGETPIWGSNAVWDAVTANWNANGYRLPTEAEWEYVCRAGTSTTYNLGAVWSGDWGWYNGNSDSKTHEVGKKAPNEWRLYDMHGNVWEWVWDCYDANYYTASEAGTDPRGPTSGARVRRGGSYGTTEASAYSVRSASRFYYGAPFVDNHIGFRLARTGE
jgi:formylglycine-generating enzyme required for sulfatase activity